MKTLRIPALIFITGVLAASLASAQSRGDGRIAGKVVDDQGQPAVDVAVRAMMVGQTEPFQTKTNKRGEWIINGIAPGQWNVDFLKDGFEPHRITVELPEDNRLPSINVKLAKAAPKVDPNEEIQAEAKKAAELGQSGKFAEARKIYEDLLAKYPTLHQIHPFIARTYAAEKNFDKAVEHVNLALAQDPENAELKLLLGDVLLEKGDKDQAIKVYESIDMTKAPDSVSFLNAAITLINDQKPDQAIALLDKVIAQWPQQPEGLYYRARAYIAAKKLPEAKADLEKFVATAKPDAREMPEAKKILEQLKDVK